MDLFRVALCGITAALLSGFAAAAGLEGRVSAIQDGDTLTIGRQIIRLSGVDAPEIARGGRPGEAGGIEARTFVENFVAGRTLICELRPNPNGRTHSGRRLLAICRLEDGRDIGRLLIRAGLARDCPAFSGSRYAADETVQGRRHTRHGYCTLHDR